MSNKNETIKVLRGILRLLRTPPLSHTLSSGTGGSGSATTTTSSSTRNIPAPPAFTRKYVLKEYRKHSNEQDPRQRQKLQRIANNFLSLHTDLKERHRLYQLDTGAEVVLSGKELSRRAAARAGLQLPKLNPDLETFSS